MPRPASGPVSRATLQPLCRLSSRPASIRWVHLQSPIRSRALPDTGHLGPIDRDVYTQRWSRNAESTRSFSLSHKAEKRPRSAKRAGQTRPVPRAAPAAVEVYQPPRAGILSYLPPSWVPYAELIRLDKQIGTYYLFLPCAFSTLVAATMATPMAHPLHVLTTCLWFFAGAFIMRGAGCTFNDLLDRDFDKNVERTRFRPIARGAITPKQALVFAGVQCLGGLVVLLQFPLACLAWGIPSLILVGLYPLAKRVTFFPQFVLGLTFSWGAVMGFPAMGIDLLSDKMAASAAIMLYSSNFCWTVLYDLIYAHMDVLDDAAAGVKSMAVRYTEQTKLFLVAMALPQVSFLGAAGMFAGSGLSYLAIGCGSAITSLAAMIWRVNLSSVSSCWWWFRYGCLFTGGGITLGLSGDYLARYTGFYPSSVNPFAKLGQDSSPLTQISSQPASASESESTSVVSK